MLNSWYIFAYEMVAWTGRLYSMAYSCSSRAKVLVTNEDQRFVPGNAAACAKITLVAPSRLQTRTRLSYF